MLYKKKCLHCRKIFKKPYNCSLQNWKNRCKFCSIQCRNKSRLGKPTWNTGLDISDERVRKNSLNNKGNFTSEKTQGDKNSLWKGDKASYAAIHLWINFHYGKATKCEICGVANKRRYHWANKDHKYDRKLENWLQLCPPCHYAYDVEHNNR